MSHLVREDRPRKHPDWVRLGIVSASWLAVLSLPLAALAFYGIRMLPDSSYARAYFEDVLQMPSEVDPVLRPGLREVKL